VERQNTRQREGVWRDQKKLILRVDVLKDYDKWMKGRR